MTNLNLHNIFCFYIIRHIATYIDDIDIHRKYKIFDKIKKDKYENLNIIGHTNMEYIPQEEYIFMPEGHMNFKYNLKNMYIPLERKENNLKDDYMTLTYSTIVDTIWITMYRIKPKNLLLEVQKRKAGWSVGVLSDTYFWEYFTWKYIQL